MKGTTYLVAAYEALRREGLHVELEIAEKVTNDAIRIRMATADIVAAQCLYGYASTELEGMSLGKPVLANLDNPYYYEALRQHPYASAQSFQSLLRPYTPLCVNSSVIRSAVLRLGYRAAPM